MLTASTVSHRSHLDFNIEKMFLYLFMFSSLFWLVDPFYSGYDAFRVTRDLGPFKYTGLVFGLAASFFCLYGMAYNRRRSKWLPIQRNLANAWPILGFGLFALCGSLVARFYFDIKETFLQMGIGVLGVPLAVVLFWCVGEQMLVARRFMQGFLLVLPIVIGWVVVKRIAGGQAFHTEMFLFIPLTVYFFVALKRRWLAWGILLSTIVLGIASHKNTAYLILLVTLTHLLLISIAQHFVRAPSLRRMIIVYGLFVVFLVGLAIVSFLLLNREELLPSGNLDVRSITYTAAIYRFLDSPIYGTGFADTTLVPLMGLKVLGSNMLETHSDMLDVLSHGGLLGASLFLFGIYRVFSGVLVMLRHPVDDQVKSLVHGLSVIVACGLITACFNSPLLMLPIGLLFWFALGLLISVVDYGCLPAIRRQANITGNEACPK